MELVLLAKDESSGRSGCPGVLLDEDGQAIVWAPSIDATTAASVPNPLPCEGGVKISMQVLIDAVDAYRKRR